MEIYENGAENSWEVDLQVMFWLWLNEYMDLEMASTSLYLCTA